MGRPAADPKVRFLAKVREVESGCHEWQSVLHRDGYGKFYFIGRQVQAHRAAYELFVGAIPFGLHVLHRCDNRKCVNPAHLYVGTAKDNVRDRNERCKWFGRMKYSEEQMHKCREMYKSGLSQQLIADQLGMHQTTVSKYVRGFRTPRKRNTSVQI